MKYKGYELMKAIADEEIKKGTKFKDKDGKKVEWNGYNFVFTDLCENYMCTISDIYFINEVFELIEDEIDAEKIYCTNNKQGITTTASDDNEKEEELRRYIINNCEDIEELLRIVKQIDKRVKKLERTSK